MTEAALELEPLQPLITDGVFPITGHDLAFLELSPAEVDIWRQRKAPLGLADYIVAFTDRLLTALATDDIKDADVRVKGSSTTFFSGPHKKMPVSRQERVSLFEADHLGRPRTSELAVIEERWSSWIRDRDPPVRRPFDSLFRLTIHRDASDIDLQLSSYEATRRASVLMNQTAPENRAPLFHPHYSFVSDQYASLVLPATFLFANDELESIGRPVTVKLFDGTGPPDKSEHSALSAHFRDSDWILTGL